MIPIIQFFTFRKDMVAKHQRYAVADPELRDSTRRKVKGLLYAVLGLYIKGSFDFSQNLIRSPSGDFEPVSEEFDGCR